MELVTNCVVGNSWRITEMGNAAEDWQMAMIRFIIGFGDRLAGHF